MARLNVEEHGHGDIVHLQPQGEEIANPADGHDCVHCTATPCPADACSAYHRFKGRKV